jgi:ABC-type uncharacterized transport system substrate-binding protein
MRRRGFITFLGGAAIAGPLAARAQKGGNIRRIGILAGLAADDPLGQVRIEAFVQELQKLGWTDGRNLQIDYRWAAGNPNDTTKYATELLSLGPDVLLATGGSSVPSLLKVSRTVPIVFANVPDPVGSGYVESLSQPGGNATGFMQFEYSLSGKWLELLKQIAPAVTRAAVLWDPALTVAIGQFAVIQAVAPSLGVEVRTVNVGNVAGIERSISDFARQSNSGLIVTASALALVHRELIVALGARYNLPAVYNQRVFVAAGGLISYGADLLDQFRRAAGYVDRILKGEKPADLPVQAPTKYQLVINLKTAKALGLDVPQTLLGRADEVIE